MNWIKKNQNTTLLIVFVMIGMSILLLSNRDTTKYTNIEVHEGDTLWSLSVRYKGNLSTDEWVSVVKNANNIIDDKIVAGHTLVIPDNKKSISTDKRIELASEKNDNE